MAVDKSCIFCKIARGEVKSQPFVMENDTFFAIHDIHPISEGHTLVIPKKHCVTLLDMPANLGKDMLEILKKVSSKLMDEKLGDGFNLIMNNLAPAGQAVMHAHVHVVPRKEKDGMHSMTQINR
ncbi:MAG: HIT family protein [Candidatus Pacearchaeota archaeon]